MSSGSCLGAQLRLAGARIQSEQVRFAFRRRGEIVTGPDNPVIHLLRKMVLRRMMDARVKPGQDECRHLDSRHTLATPRREAPESLHKSSAPIEGVGNAGCPLHPRPRVPFVLVERTRVTTSTPESPGIPARNGFTAYVVLLCPQNLPECANGRFSPTARRWI